jgi:hypothetical protein
MSFHEITTYDNYSKVTTVDYHVYIRLPTGLCVLCR